MGRFPRCYETSSLKKGPWTPEEDKKLVDYITKNGYGCWRSPPKLAGLNRCGKSCRLRWTNYLRPDIKHGKFSEEEERIIINLHSSLGNKWSKIANHLPGRTDNEIKNCWNTCLRKKLLQMGIDPNTHKPRTDLNPILNLSQLLSSPHLINLIRNVTTTTGTTHPNNWANNILVLQAQTTSDQLLKIQLMQNLFRAINSANNTFLSPQNLNSLFHACTIANRSTSTVSSIDYQIQNPGFVHCDQSQAIINDLSSWRCIENGWIKNPSAKMLQGIIHDDIIDPLPKLVSDQPLTKQMKNKSASDEHSSTIFEAWDKLFDNGETSESYWKDILDIMSHSPTP